MKKRKCNRYIRLLYYKFFKWKDCPHLCCLCKFKQYCYNVDYFFEDMKP